MSDCPECGGCGEVPCTECSGEGVLDCSVCGGTGEEENAN